MIRFRISCCLGAEAHNKFAPGALNLVAGVLATGSTGDGH